MLFDPAALLNRTNDGDGHDSGILNCVGRQSNKVKLALLCDIARCDRKKSKNVIAVANIPYIIGA